MRSGPIDKMRLPGSLGTEPDPVLTPEQVVAIHNYEVYNGPESIHKTQKLALCDSHEVLREQLREAEEQRDLFKGQTQAFLDEIRRLRDAIGAQPADSIRAWADDIDSGKCGAIHGEFTAWLRALAEIAKEEGRG